MRDPNLESRFPKLRSGGYDEKSPVDPKYNCVAFAVGLDRRFWQWMPKRTKGYYWPIDWGNSLESWMEVFRIHGYEPCDNGDFETGIVKIAIFVDEDRVPSHVAKQDVDSRKWISKLGRGKDIVHDNLDMLSGSQVDEYGEVEAYMAKRLTTRSAWSETENEETKTQV